MDNALSKDGGDRCMTEIIGLTRSPMSRPIDPACTSSIWCRSIFARGKVAHILC